MSRLSSDGTGPESLMIVILVLVILALIGAAAWRFIALANVKKRK
jgi:Tfp pilus assembly protein PilX